MEVLNVVQSVDQCEGLQESNCSTLARRWEVKKCPFKCRATPTKRWKFSSSSNPPDKKGERRRLEGMCCSYS